jgi:hypothetical protein
MKYHTRNINYYDFGYNTTQITGRLVTNNFLIDGGSVTYADATVQNSAFTNTLKTNVENMKYNTRNVIYYDDGFDTTQIGGRIVTNNLRLYNGNIGFSDGTFQNSAFTNELQTLLQTLSRKKIYCAKTFDNSFVSSSYTLNKEFNNNITFDTTTMTYNPIYLNEGGITSGNQLLRQSRFLVRINFKIVGIKWYLKFLVGCRTYLPHASDYYEGLTVRNTGVELAASSTNEPNFNITHTYIYDHNIPQPVYIEMYFNHRYASALTGTIDATGIIELIEL